MMEAINWYLDTWWKIMARPIYFYVTLPSDSWSSKPLTFASVSAWALAAGLTITLFFTQYVPVGLTLVEGLSLKSLLIVSPVILLMALIFLALTLLVLGAISMGVFLGILYGVGVLIHFMLKM
ncbi:MAG: hypothetical protein NT030_07265, partial [Candidatus Saganbacteria bacterium]|nr:hypothetical protein [Candidatus Saganbacteria bacterium]